jgi:DNA-binding phage protein
MFENRPLAGVQATQKAGEIELALTRDFKETIKARVQRDRAYRRELLREGVECLLAGDVETGKTILHDYINASVGFAELAAATHHSPKSLMRMLGPRGNPQARNLFEIVAYLQQKEGVRFEIRAH